LGKKNPWVYKQLGAYPNVLENGWMNGCIHVMHPMDIKYGIWNRMDVCMHASTKEDLSNANSVCFLLGTTSFGSCVYWPCLPRQGYC